MTAKTIFGAMYGLESLAQLTNYQASNKLFVIPSVPLTINDSPRFPWRGLLIDSARHYLDVPTIKRMIDGLAASKVSLYH